MVYYLSVYLSNEFEITVFCSSIGVKNKINSYNNCKLVYVPFNANGAQSVPFDIVSILKSYKKFDKVLILGSSGAIILPFLRSYKNKFIFNFGGLDWNRSKWGRLSRKFLKFSEKLGINNSGHIVSDNLGIKKYIEETYNKESELITYGGDQAFKITPKAQDFNKYYFLKSRYAFSVARIQPDNNIDLILDSFDEKSKFPLVFVGNWDSCTYGIETKKRYFNKPNLILLDAIYNQEELNLLRSNCEVYIHGHSAGGTNPALVEAMNLGLPVFAFDCNFNRYTTNFKAHYFKNSYDLNQLIDSISQVELENNRKFMLSIAQEDYQWKTITLKYSKKFNE